MNEHRQVRSSIFCAKNSTDMPWSTSNRIVQNAAHFLVLSPPGRSLNIIEKIEGLSLIDTSFAPTTARGRYENEWPCDPLSFVMGVGMIPNIHSLTR